MAFVLLCLGLGLDFGLTLEFTCYARLEEFCFKEKSRTIPLIPTDFLLAATKEARAKEWAAESIVRFGQNFSPYTLDVVDFLALASVCQTTIHELNSPVREERYVTSSIVFISRIVTDCC